MEPAHEAASSPLAALLPLALGGCSNLFSGMAVGGLAWLDGPGAAGIKLVQTAYGRLDLAAAGQHPADRRGGVLQQEPGRHAGADRDHRQRQPGRRSCWSR